MSNVVYIHIYKQKEKEKQYRKLTASEWRQVLLTKGAVGYQLNQGWKSYEHTKLKTKV